MITISNLNKSFSKQVLFKDFNVDIASGEVVAFTGKSGCGKTTLLNMIGAIEPVDSGSIMVNGIQVCEKSNQIEYYRNVVGFLFQNYVLIENKTVKENLELIHPRCRESKSIEEVLIRVDLLDKINQKVYTLSGGEQQRIALARLMLKKCLLILADEPTGSLDHDNGRKVFEYLQMISKEQGKTVLLVTHDSQLAQNCDRVIPL